MARIIFDLDGTLVDSNPTITAASNLYLAEIGRPPVSPEVSASFLGRGMRVLVERLLLHTGGIEGRDLDEELARYKAIYARDPVTGTTVYPGVYGALADLAAAGHGLGVCTQKANGPSLTILKALGLIPPITAFTGGDSLDVLKPDPRMLLHAAGQLPPGPAILVGDSETDAATAANAGVPFLLHTEGYRLAGIDAIPHAAAFSDFAELPRLVAEFAGASAGA